MGGQWHLDADTYLAMVRAEVPLYDVIQDRTAAATKGVVAASILDLGSGTGVTAKRVFQHHPGASLIGIDSSAAMVSLAARAVPEATFIEAGLQDPLPAGPFDLVVSAFAVHHLPSRAKADLFERVAAVLSPAGRFVLCDVVIPEHPVATPVPVEPGVDLPDSVNDQIRWLTDAGFDASVVFAEADLAVVRADRR